MCSHNGLPNTGCWHVWNSITKHSLGWWMHWLDELSLYTASTQVLLKTSPDQSRHFLKFGTYSPSEALHTTVRIDIAPAGSALHSYTHCLQVPDFNSSTLACNQDHMSTRKPLRQQQHHHRHQQQRRQQQQQQQPYLVGAWVVGCLGGWVAAGRPSWVGVAAGRAACPLPLVAAARGVP
jgi:hypothetical protein